MGQTLDLLPLRTPPARQHDEPGITQANPGVLRLTLLQSRQRWRQFGAIAVDLAFETDAKGQIAFIAPETVLGWSAAALFGQPARTLLADATGLDPFRCTGPIRRRHVWMRSASGTPVCMALSTTPMLDDAGVFKGIRGVAVNMTAEDQAEAATTSALRRGEVLEHVLSAMRQEVLAPRMMRAVLDSVQRALGAEGACVLDLLHLDPPLVLHAVGAEARLLDPRLPPDVLRTLAEGSDDTTTFDLADGTQLLACPCSTRFGDRSALLTWRLPETRAWDADDLTLASSVTGVMRIVLEHEAIQRELARQARTDPLTGLLNRRAFLDEATRRLDRLERDGLPATLLFIDLDRLKMVNDRFGHETGDSALLLASALLHRTFRPSDLVARLGGDEFAIWLDGADQLTAAERAESLRLAAPNELAHLADGEIGQMGMSIGIATRQAGSDETLDHLLHRADQAMYDVKRNGRGHWRVSQTDQTR